MVLKDKWEEVLNLYYECRDEVGFVLNYRAAQSNLNPCAAT